MLMVIREIYRRTLSEKGGGASNPYFWLCEHGRGAPADRRKLLRDI
jgi:hypothetical protein